MEAVTGTLPQDIDGQVVEEEAHEALVGDQADVDPWYVDADDLQAQTG